MITQTRQNIQANDKHKEVYSYLLHEFLKEELDNEKEDDPDSQLEEGTQSDSQEVFPPTAPGPSSTNTSRRNRPPVRRGRIPSPSYYLDRRSKSRSRSRIRSRSRSRSPVKRFGKGKGSGKGNSGSWSQEESTCVWCGKKGHGYKYCYVFQSDCAAGKTEYDY